MKKWENNKGFTLVEIILVISIIGILAVTAIPQFYDLTSMAQAAARDGVVSVVRGGIYTYSMNALATGARQYPLSLDNGMPPGACTGGARCFNAVLRTWLSVADASNWEKLNWNVYRHKPTASVYGYNNLSGAFDPM